MENDTATNTRNVALQRSSRAQTLTAAPPPTEACASNISTICSGPVDSSRHDSMQRGFFDRMTNGTVSSTICAIDISLITDGSFYIILIVPISSLAANENQHTPMIPRIFQVPPLSCHLGFAKSAGSASQFPFHLPDNQSTNKKS